MNIRNENPEEPNKPFSLFVFKDFFNVVVNKFVSQAMAILLFNKNLSTVKAPI
jgi:hypothetical protein